MAIETLIVKGAETVLTVFGSGGAKILVNEAVKKLTPDDLNKMQEYCIEVAKWGGATAASTVVAYGIKKNLESAQKLYKKVNAAFDKLDKKNPDAEKEDNIQTEVEEDEIPVVDLD